MTFRAGDVFWRDGTRSVRISQQCLEEIIEQRIADERSGWLEEQQEIRRRERAGLEAAYEGRHLTEAPLGSVNLDLDAGTLTLAALETVRQGDRIALRHLLNGAVSRARTLIGREDIYTGVGDLLDKLACLAATFLEYDEDGWFSSVIGVLAQIYSMPVAEEDDRRFGYSTDIDWRRTPRQSLPARRGSGAGRGSDREAGRAELPGRRAGRPDSRPVRRDGSQPGGGLVHAERRVDAGHISGRACSGRGRVSSGAVTALAFAEAPGLPPELWQLAVRVLAGAHVTTEQLTRFARGSAANFLVESAGESATVAFRLFHQALSDALYTERARLVPSAADEGTLTRAFTGYGARIGWDRAPT